MECAYNKRGGGKCHAKAIKGRKGCRLHGGVGNEPGPTHPNWKHGRRSRYLIPRLVDKYRDFLNDPDSMSFLEDAAVLNARLEDLLEHCEREPFVPVLRGLLSSFRQSVAAGRMPEAQRTLDQIDAVVDGQVVNEERWNEIYRVSDILSKIKEREHKRIQASDQAIPIRDLMAVLSQIVDVAKNTIHSTADRQAFIAGLEALGIVHDNERLIGGGTTVEAAVR